MAEKAA
jgi:hypothetical protein